MCSALRGDTFFGVIYVVLGAVGYSSKAIFIKLAYRYGVDATTLLALRMAFSLPAFLVLAIGSLGQREARTLAMQHWPALLWSGLLGYYIASYLDFLGLQYVSAGLERLVLFSYPTLVVLLAAVVYGRKVNDAQAHALMLCYAGIALVVSRELTLSSADGHTFLGVALVFASAWAYAFYLLGAERLIAAIGSLPFTAYAMTVSCLACILQFVYARPLSALVLPGAVYAHALGMALFATVLPAFLLSAGIRRLGAGQAAILGTLGPVSTLLLAWVFLQEDVTLVQLLGALLVLGGAIKVSALRSTRK